jgi:hypothetical protein
LRLENQKENAHHHRFQLPMLEKSITQFLMASINTSLLEDISQNCLFMLRVMFLRTLGGWLLHEFTYSGLSHGLKISFYSMKHQQNLPFSRQFCEP